MSNKLSFGEELLLDEECTLGETDEVAVFLCALCGIGTIAGCILCGCEVPILFGAGAAIMGEAAAMATAGGAVTPV